MRLHRSRSLLAVAMLAVTATAFVASGGAAAGAKPLPPVHCPTDDLQAAIAQAAPGSTIAVDGTCTGHFAIDKDLTIVGPAILDGSGTPGSVLVVSTGVVQLNNVTIQHGTGTPVSGFGVVGGGVFNSGGTLTINGSTVIDNMATTGGGIMNMATLTLNRTIVTHNSASFNGGGIAIIANNPGIGNARALTTLNSSTVSDNTAVAGSSGILSGQFSDLVVNQSTITANRVTGSGVVAGGGITQGSHTGTTVVAGSTVSGNSSFVGGGLFVNAGALTVTKTNVSGNHATAGGGLGVCNGTATFANSAFSGNSGLSNPASYVGVYVVPSGTAFNCAGTFTETHSTFTS